MSADRDSVYDRRSAVCGTITSRTCYDSVTPARRERATYPCGGHHALCYSNVTLTLLENTSDLLLPFVAAAHKHARRGDEYAADKTRPVSHLHERAHARQLRPVLLVEVLVHHLASGHRLALPIHPHYGDDVTQHDLVLLRVQPHQFRVLVARQHQHLRVPPLVYVHTVGLLRAHEERHLPDHGDLRGAGVEGPDPVARVREVHSAHDEKHQVERHVALLKQQLSRAVKLLPHLGGQHAHEERAAQRGSRGVRRGNYIVRK
eukprot:2376162-Pyramimonas_sp.AAC.2